MTQVSAEAVGSPDLVYVDLDGALIRTDLVLESVLDLLRRAPFELLKLLLVSLFRGWTYFKTQLAAESRLDVKYLPFRASVVEQLRALHARGDRLVLASSADPQLASAVAQHLGLFSDVLAGRRGANKDQAIRAHADGKPFTYINKTEIARRKEEQTNVFFAVLRAIRPHQWLKNVLVFVPLMTAHMIGDVHAVLRTADAFLAFCMCASSIYLLNDLLDLPSDRRHPRKRMRPLAAGALPLSYAIVLAPALFLGGAYIASMDGWDALGVLGLYVAISVAYSAHLKTFVIIDVITLAILYTMRIFVGGVAAHVELSFWILAFSMCMFLSLALIKRCSELTAMAKIQREHAHGRDYALSDRAVVLSLGVASGFAAVLVFALFINTAHVAATYHHPQVLWLLCITMLYWIARMWVKTERGEMHDDPLVYAARDRASLIMLALSALIAVLAL
jgi:4-hydroxybenzoate polyprenyltransferase/phosphoserine phosphatase